MKCSDYFIVKLRYYADEKVLKAYYKTPGHESLPLPKQHWERAQQYTKLYWEFVEMVTGRNHESWFKEYLFMTKECVEDELKESFGIIIMGGEGWATFLIPTRHTDFFEWVKENTTVPIKILKKTNMFYVNHWGTVINKERREAERKHTIEFCEKHKLAL